MTKRFFSVLLAICLLLGAVPLTAYAAQADDDSFSVLRPITFYNIDISGGTAVLATNGSELTMASPKSKIRIIPDVPEGMVVTDIWCSGAEMDGDTFIMPEKDVEVHVLCDYPSPQTVFLANGPAALQSGMYDAILKNVNGTIHRLPNTDGSYDLDLDNDGHDDIHLTESEVSALAGTNLTASYTIKPLYSVYTPITFVFAKEIIGICELSVKLPHAGDPWDFETMKPEFTALGEHFTIEPIGWYNEWGIAPSSFEAGEKYFASCRLVPDSGYAFTHDTVALINEKQADYTDTLSKGAIYVSSRPFVIPGEPHKINIIGDAVASDTLSGEDVLTEQVAGETVYIVTDFSNLPKGKYVKSVKFSSEDVEITDNMGYFFEMPNHNVTVEMEVEYGECQTVTLDFTKQNAIIMIEDDFDTASAILDIFYAEIKNWTGKYDEYTDRYYEDFDLDGDGSYDLRYEYSMSAFVKLDTFSLNNPSGRRTIRTDAYYYSPYNTVNVIFADAAPNKITVNGGAAYASSGDFTAKKKITEALPGEYVFLYADADDLGDDRYVAQFSVEATSSDVEIIDDAAPFFIMPDHDVTVNLTYTKGKQTNGILDLRGGASYTAKSAEAYVMSERYGMYFILIQKSANTGDNWTGESKPMEFYFDVDGDGGYDILYSESDSTFRLMDTSSLDDPSGSVTLSLTREESYTLPMRTLTILFGGAPGYALGDVNRDGVVDINDATYVQMYAAELIALDAEQLVLGDVNRDGVVDINDATYIQMYAADLIASFG